MDTALPQKFPFILDRNLAKTNCTENHICTSCDTVVLVTEVFSILKNVVVFPRFRADFLQRVAEAPQEEQ